MNKIRYSVVQNKATGMDAIKLLDEPFAGIIFCYGRVKINVSEENSQMSIDFEYEILDKGSKDFGNIEPFEKYIGDLLEYMIHSQIEQELQPIH